MLRGATNRGEIRGYCIGISETMIVFNDGGYIKTYYLNVFRYTVRRYHRIEIENNKIEVDSEKHNATALITMAKDDPVLRGVYELNKICL